MFLDVVTVVNRRNMPFETQFDGQVIAFKPYEEINLPRIVAVNIMGASAIQLDLETGVTTLYALGIKGHKAYPTDKIDGDLGQEAPLEVIDRSQSPLLTDSEPMALSADGVESLGVGKKPKFKTISTGAVQKRGPQYHGDAGDSRVVNKKVS